MASFSKNDRVRGVVCGRFVVVDVKVTKDGREVVSVRELGPANEIGSKVMRFPADILRFDNRT